MNKNYNCYFELTLDVVGGKWKPIILYYIGSREYIRFSELKHSIPNINERMLTRQLRELEASKIINRKSYNVVPPRVEYSLPEIGKELIPLLEQFKNWGIKYNKLYNIHTFEMEKNCSVIYDK